MYNEKRPGNGRSRPGAVHPSTSTGNARKSNSGGQNGGIAVSGGIAGENHPVELSEIPKWDPVVPEWETPGWATESMDTTDWEPPVPGNWDPPDFGDWEPVVEAIPPTPGKRWGTGGEPVENKEKTKRESTIKQRYNHGK